MKYLVNGEPADSRDALDGSIPDTRIDRFVQFKKIIQLHKLFREQVIDRLAKLDRE